ncbi:MAG TPA: deoxyribose-phosphate aldolase [bacterium]|nr:deoxyribose-phosphate aldolase [bacterium]
MNLTEKDIAGMIDFSGVAGGLGEDYVEMLAREAVAHRFKGVIVMPCYMKKLGGLLAGQDDILPGTVVGFPSGAGTTGTKVFEAKQCVSDGAEELDMVINVGALRSGAYGYCRDEVAAVVDSAGGKTVKVILETHYLADDEVKRGCEICAEAGAGFVKTSTGWADTGATEERVRLMKTVVGDALEVKAAGGIRTAETLVKLYRAGATRFGIGAESALKIIKEVRNMPGGAVVV